MGFLSAMSSSLFHYTTDGRRVCRLRVPVPGVSGPTYLVADADVARVRRRLHRVQLVFFLVLIPLWSAFVSLPSNREAATGWPVLRVLLLLGLPGLAMFPAIQLWVLRGLPRVSVDPSMFVRVAWRESALNSARAMGIPTTSLLLAAGVLMTAGQVALAILDGVWWAYPGSLLMGASAIYMTWQLITLLRLRGVKQSGELA